ncbi:MAG: aromatic ring-hydroxylating dioxygenase subunit alpha [Dokdonella sp.]
MKSLPTIDLQAQPLGTATALPAPAYLHPEWAQRERDGIFAKSWQLVGEAARLSARGSHMQLDVAGVPLWLLRGHDGTLRALHNVCRHRAGPLLPCPVGNHLRLRCRYHGWTYAEDGQLISATEMQSADAFDADSIQLPQARVAEWNGLVFVCLDPSGPELAEVLKGIDQRMGTGRLAGYHYLRSVSYTVGCNWKAYVDNFLEGYHLPHIHPALNRLLDYRSYRTELAAWSSLQYSPLENEGALYGSGEALYWYIWPNTMLNLLPGRLQTNRVVPIAPNECRVDFDYYYPATRSAEAHERDFAFSDEVQAEDIDICEKVQRGLESGSYVAGRLNPLRESGVHHFHELIRAAMRATL